MASSGNDVGITRKGSWEYEVIRDGHLFYIYRNPITGWEVFQKHPCKLWGRPEKWARIDSGYLFSILIALVVQREEVK